MEDLELITKSDFIIHNGHVAKEIVFQELIRNKVYENISVKELKASAGLISGSILNYLFLNKIENMTTENLVTDRNAYDNTYWRNRSISCRSL